MNEARAESSSESLSQAPVDESGLPAQNAPEASEAESTDNNSVLSITDFASILLSPETEQPAGCEVTAPKANASQLMATIMTMFTDYVEYEFMPKILDATSTVEDSQDFTGLLKALVNYLLDQNKLLLQCLADVGLEAEKRADMLQQRLRETAATTRDTVQKISEWGEVLLALVTEKRIAEQTALASRCMVEMVSEENSRLKSRNENLDHDLHSLLSIIQVARTTGNWEMDCVTFCDLSPEDVYGTICRLSSAQHSDISRSAAMNDSAPDGSTAMSEVEGACAMNGTYSQSEADFLSPSNHIDMCTPESPVRWYPPQDAGTSGGTTYFALPRRPAREEPGAGNQAVAVKVSSYTRASASLDSFFTPVVPPSVNNEEMWARRRLFPSSPVLERQTPRNLSDAPHHVLLYSARVHSNRDAESPKTQMCSLEGTAACGTLKSQDHPQPLGATSGAGGAVTDHQCCSVKMSSQKDASAGDESQPGPTTSSGRAPNSPSVMDISTQTEDFAPTYGVTSTQTDAELELSLPSGNVERDQELCSLRERLNLASQEAQSKTLLALQLQTHLDASSKQVELMEQAVQNLEKKLSSSRQECINLKKEVKYVNEKLEHEEAATKKEQKENEELKIQLQQLSITVQHLRDAVVHIKKSGAAAAKEESSMNHGPRVHNV